MPIATHPAPRWSPARLVLVLVCLVLQAAGAAALERPVGIDPVLSADGGTTSFRLTLSARVEPRILLLEGPDRVVVDLPGAVVQPGEIAAGAGLVAAARLGEAGPDRARVILRLASPASVARAAVGAGPVEGTWRLAVDLVRASRAEFRRAVATALDDVASATGSLAKDGGRRPVVVLDAGHGGVDPGAKAGNGALEKDLTLLFVRELRERLAGSPLVSVVLTRDSDVFVPLDERVARARAAGADLFLSFHADSIGSASVRGATIYTGAERATDAESAILADRENAADLFGGTVPAGRLGEDVSSILQDLMARETRSFSHRLAAGLHGALSPVIRFTVQPHREASFRVLRASDIPSALVELGYLTNARDTELMFSPEWRGRCADAVVKAIERFFAGRRVAGAAVSP